VFGSPAACAIRARTAADDAAEVVRLVGFQEHQVRSECLQLVQVPEGEGAQVQSAGQPVGNIAFDAGAASGQRLQRRGLDLDPGLVRVEEGHDRREHLITL